MVHPLLYIDIFIHNHNHVFNIRRFINIFSFFFFWFVKLVKARVAWFQLGKERNKNEKSKCTKRVQRLMKRLYPIIRFFSSERKIRYLQYMMAAVPWMVEISSAWQVQNPSTAGHPSSWSSSLAFPFFFFFLWFEIPDSPPWLPACSNDLEWSYSSLFSPTVHVCSKMSKNTSTMCSIQTHGAKDYCPSRERKKTSFDQAKAMHQDSPRTEATSEDWVRPTLVYRPSCAEYFMTEPVPVPSPELDSTDELTCKTAKQKRLMFIWTNGKSQEE